MQFKITGKLVTNMRTVRVAAQTDWNMVHFSAQARKKIVFLISFENPIKIHYSFNSYSPHQGYKKFCLPLAI